MEYVANKYNKEIHNKGQNNFYELYDDNTSVAQK